MAIFSETPQTIKAEMDLMLSTHDKLKESIADLKQNIKTHKDFFPIMDGKKRYINLFNVTNKLKGIALTCNTLISLAKKRGFANYSAIITTISKGATEIAERINEGLISTADQAEAQVKVAIENSLSLALSELRKDIENALIKLQEAQKVGSRA